MPKRKSSTQCHSAGSPDQTDTILVVEDVEILVNRNMLSALSPYFECLLMGDFKEKSQTRIELKEVKLDVFSECLDIMNGVDLKYTPGEMGLEHLNNLLSYADRFDIDAVRMFCQWEMNFKSPGQEVDRYLLACQHMLPDQTKEMLRSFLTSSILSSWSHNEHSNETRTKSPMLSLSVTDLARVIDISSGIPYSGHDVSISAASCTPKKKKYRRNSNLPAPIRTPSPTDVLVDEYIAVEDIIFPVNKSMMCYLSPYFYNRFTEVAGKGKRSKEAMLHLENVKADVFRDCMNIVYGKPVDNYSPGTMATSRLLDLLDLSTRLSLSPVRVFCSMELALPPKGGNHLERYLMACHFNLHHCKAVLLASLSLPYLTNLDVAYLTAIMHLDHLNVEFDDIRSLLTTVHSNQSKKPDLSSIKDQSASATASPFMKTPFTKKSATSDVVLQAGNIEFHVNRMVMGSLSDYFRKLMGEGKEKVHFVLDRVDPFLFGLCLHIMHGKMPKNYKRGELSSRYMFGLLEYSYRFDMAPVQLFCEHEVFKYEGNEMDRFLLSRVYFPDESESLLSDLTPEKVGSWLERDSDNGFSPAQCPVSLTVPQLCRLIKLAIVGHLVDEKSGVHIYSRVSSDKMDLTATNKGKLYLVLDIRTNNPSTVVQYRKLAPGDETKTSVAIGSANALNDGQDKVQITLYNIEQSSLSYDAEYIMRYGYYYGGRVSEVFIPLVQ